MKVNMFSQKLLLCGVALAPLALGTAHAQISDSDDVIIVTAQKREQALEDVPISVAVIDNEFIEKSDLRDVNDYIDLVPNVSGEGGQLAGGGVGVRVRGVGRLGGDANTFGLYIDGFDVTGATSGLTGTRLVDAERIEVLRGPQGTAFGRNVVAGAINITSLTPTTDRYSGRVSFDVGNFDTFGASGRVNMPLSDSTAVLLSGFYDTTNGYVENIGPSGGSNDEENFGFRLGLQSDPSDALSVKASISFENLSKGINGFVPDGDANSTVQTFQGLVNLGANPFLPPGSLDSQLDTFFPEQSDQIALDVDEFSDAENLIGTLRFDYDLGGSTLVWVSGFSHQDLTNRVDGDGSELDNVVEDSQRDRLFYSTELRLQSNGDNRLDWIAGVFANRSKTDRRSDSVAGENIRLSTFLPPIPQVLGPLVPLFPQGVFAVDVLPGEALEINDEVRKGFGAAVFADLDYEITDRLTVMVGGRYSYDEQEQTVVDLVDINSDPAFPIPDTVFVPFVFPDVEGETDSDAFTWRASAVYEATDNFNVYATTSRGYRPGGLQLGNVTPTDTTQISFAPEFINNYEIGFKANFFDRRLLINAATYFMDWTDIQFTVLDPVSGEPSTGNAEAEAYGVEFDALVQPMDGLTLNLGFAYNESEFVSLNNGDPNDPRIGQPLPYAPEITANATIDYQRPLFGEIDGFVRATFVYSDERTDQLTGPANQRVLPAYERVDFRFGLAQEANWRLEGYVTNAFDETYATSTFTNGFITSGNLLLVAPPRQYGARLTKEF